MSGAPPGGCSSADAVAAPVRLRRRFARWRRSLSHRARGLLAPVLLRGSSYLSLRATQRLANALAWPLSRMPIRVTRSIRTNLQLCYPGMGGAARSRIVRQSLAQSLQSILELGPLWSGSLEQVQALVCEVVGLEWVEAALRAGRGVLVLGPHLGSWEMLSLYVGYRFHCHSLYRPPHVRGLEQIYTRSRERLGARLAPANAGGVRALYRALQQGEMVGTLPDQDPGLDAGIFVPFFGVASNTSTLVARMLVGTGAEPVLAWAERLDHGRGYRIHFSAPSQALREARDVEALTAALNLELEGMIRQRPEQYLWTYQRFRRSPCGQRNPYRRRR